MSGPDRAPLPDMLVLDFIFVPQGAEPPPAWRAARPESVALSAQWRTEPQREDPWPNSF